MRNASSSTYDVLGGNRTIRMGSYALGWLISALNGLVWVGVAWFVCWWAGFGTKPLLLLGVWLVTTYLGSIAVLGVKSSRHARSSEDADDAAASTASAAAYAPDAAPPRPRSTR